MAHRVFLIHAFTTSGTTYSSFDDLLYPSHYLSPSEQRIVCDVCHFGTCPALFTPPQTLLKFTISINPHPISPSFPFPLDSHILPANNTLPEVPIYKFHRAPNGTVLYTTIEKPRAQKQHHVLVTNTRPPLAGPFAFSRIPRPHRDIPRLFLSQEIQNTWLFDNTYSG